MDKRTWQLLKIIFIFALLVRFAWFKNSTYFGFDEARDAYVSQAIYRNLDLKLMGPPANAPGLNHGVLHWYVLGIVYLVGGGNPYFVSFVFRLVNALGVFVVFFITNKMFGKRVGLLVSLLFAFSFEQTQYALYMGNPSLAIFSWMAIFSGFSIILKEKHKFWGLPLVALGVSTGVQLELFLVTLIGLAMVGAIVLRRKMGKISIQSWVLSIFLGMIVVSPYVISELKYRFNGFKSALNLVTHGYNVIGDSETKWSVYLKRFILMFHDNVFPTSNILLKVVALLIIGFLVVKAINNRAYRLVLLWIFGGLFLLLFGAYNAYYVNVGIGTGIIIGVALFLNWIFGKSKLVFILCLGLILAGNIKQIVQNNRVGLIGDIKTQQFMLLSDELRVVEKMYTIADGKAFTIRATSMPYLIPTVWAYLFEHFGLSRYGYLPYWETGSILGFPGELPQPKNGSTCLRFLLQEPSGGIPDHLYQLDLKEENKFSTIEAQEKIGHFVIQQRQSVDATCHNHKPSDR